MVFSGKYFCVGADQDLSVDPFRACVSSLIFFRRTIGLFEFSGPLGLNLLSMPLFFQVYHLEPSAFLTFLDLSRRISLVRGGKILL